jgi:hypothetical protein
MLCRRAAASQSHVLFSDGERGLMDVMIAVFWYNICVEEGIPAFEIFIESLGENWRTGLYSYVFPCCHNESIYVFDCELIILLTLAIEDFYHSFLLFQYSMTDH